MMFPRVAKPLSEPAPAGLTSSSVLVGALWAALSDHLWAGFLAAAAFQLAGAGVFAGLRRRSA
jgi:hypothetical protein